MKLPTTAWWALCALASGGALAAWAGCGSFGSDDPAAAPDGAVAEGSADGDASAPSEEAGVDAGCATTSEKVLAEADGLIAMGNNMTFGEFTVCSMTVGRCLVRFPLNPATKKAFANGEVRKLELLLTRVTADPNCGSSGNSGPCDGTFRKDGGVLTARPLRPDWNEKSMTWFNRDSSNLWAVPGADGMVADIDDVAGTRFVGPNEDNVTLALEVTKVPGERTMDAGSLAFRLEHSESAFVLATHEKGAGTAELRITFCK